MKNITKPTVLDLFYKQVERAPEQIAISGNGEEMTFRMLNEKANQLANYLIKQGVKYESPVGICMERSVQMIVGILGVLKAGGAFVPIDPQYPVDRISYILENTAARFVLSTQAAFQKIEDVDRSENPVIILLDSSTHSIDSHDVTQPRGGISPSQLAYIIYTSGSTGRPKGVMIEHRSLANYIIWSADFYLQNQPSVFPLYTSIAFDLTITSIFTPLTTGNRLVIYEDDSTNLVVEKVFTDGIANVIKLTPSHLKLVGRSQNVRANIPQSPLKLIVGGEELETALVQEIHDLFSYGVEIFNEYGPTEATVGCMIYKFNPDEQGLPTVPIGIGIDNCEIHLLDEHLRPVEQGSIGEIYISGDCLARGYYANVPLTDERFLDYPSAVGKKMYKTGDNAMMLPERGLLYKGRSDDQVKLRGYRIELGEIDYQISNLDGIKDAITIVREDYPGLQRLVSYVVLENEIPEEWPLAKNWRTVLKLRLPDYMIPDVLAFLSKFPLTVNGKVDKKALSMPVVSRDIQGNGTLYRKPTSILEEQIVSLWQVLLGIDQIGIDDNFFEWGGNSLLAQQTITKLQQHVGTTIPITKLYQFPTATRLAAAIQQATRFDLPLISRETIAEKRNKRVAIIGMDGRFPGAKNIEEFWEVLLSGKETVTFFQDHELDSTISDELRNSQEYVKARGIIDQAEWFDASVFGITPVMARLMDPQQRIFLEMCRNVLEQTGYLATKHRYTIGVYAGSGNSTYFMNNVQRHPEEIDKIGEFQTLLANEKDYLATRVAYQLDLRGGAVSINTACSTSLVATAQAIEAIRNGQCDMAIAGGISITVPINSGQRFEEGAMFSQDGHTCTFDATATGTVFSDGGGVVLLKDLESAQADGDTIYAVVDGVGISNDGGGKGSFMAPSSEGQAVAIRMAMIDSGMQPDDIGYVEAHGTATPLGDPIEIEGLTLAFGLTKEKQFCRIGSVKSNFGHLTHAAGVAGLIKTALSLYHGILPPSINFKAPNPNIDFLNSPFTVNNELFELPRQKRFVAGVSSFGVGGTNAHVILSSYPANPSSPAPSTAAELPALITWSAKTRDAGEGYAKKLADYLQDNPNESLESVAYTLQQTREQLNFRYAITASDCAQAIEQLRSGKYLHHELYERTENLVFLFPGQGAQYPGMGSGLYQYEPVYRDAVDVCAQILKTEIGEDIRHLIFPEEALSPEQATLTLRNTRYTQPALFITTYALAKLWMSWGIQPTAFIGHSVGEFVAATLSDIFSLDDALKLIAMRGKLSASVPVGSMLSVRAPAEEIQVLLPKSLSMAANNAPELCVVAGPDDQIAAFSGILEEKEIVCKTLHTSHAFHSDMMRPILDPFERAVASVKLSVPKLPIISTVTGSWLTDKQAVDPAYWANHMISTVRFSDAVRFAEHELNKPTYIEAGPGQVTATLTKQHGAGLSPRVLSSIKAADVDECISVRQALARMWMRGGEPQWPALYRQVPAILRRLPTYAYDRKQYWIYPQSHIENHETPNNDGIPNKQTVYTTMRKDNLITQVRSILENASGIDISGAPSSANFIELGLDSLLLTQVAQSLKKAFNVPITFRMLNEECRTLDLLGSYLDNHLPKDAYAVKNPVSSSTQEQMVVPPSMPLALQENSHRLDAISLISQQINLISQQIALLQGAAPTAIPYANGTLATVHLQADGKSTVTKPIDETAQLTAEEAVEIKKPFGATARIEKQSTTLNERQSVYLSAFIDRYVAKTAKSKSYTQRYRNCMADPRVVSGFRPTTKEIVYSIVANKSKGCRLWDLDGNEYIDVLNGFGSNFLGYQPEVVKRALIQQVEEGYEIGPQHEKAGEVCKLISELTGLDRVGLCNTGSEAVLGAMRIARTVTGRSTIVAFANSYHGIMDEVIVRGSKKLKTYPAASGIMPESVQNMLILDYGTEESLQIIKERALEFAAILVEPLQSRRPEFLPVDFLKQLRKICSESGSALIFDEVISGFRFHPAGIQGLLGIEADIATYGKVAGAGISVGIIAGKSQFMDALDGGFWQYGDDSVPETGVTYFAGTFVRHPLALATTKASLEYLKEQGPKLQEKVNKQTKKLVDKLNGICESYHTPLYIAHFGSLWKIKYHKEYPYSELLCAAMRLKGVHIQDGFPCYMTTAHTEEDINKIIEAFEHSVAELVKAGFIPTSDPVRSLYNGTFGLNPVMPPVPNARLGKNQNGNPAWFVADENNPGNYLQIELQ